MTTAANDPIEIPPPAEQRAPRRTRRSAVASDPLPPMPPLPPAIAAIASTGDSLLAEADAPVAFIVDGLLEPGDVMMLSGAEKDALKTWQLLALAVARIVGGTWLGRQVARAESGRVLFVSTETSRRNIARRLRALCRGHNIDAMHVASRLVVVDQPITILPREVLERKRWQSAAANSVATLKIGDSERRASLERNVEAIAEGEARRLGRNLDVLEAILDAPASTWVLICIDTVRQTLEGDENSSADAARYTQGCREMGRAARCPVALSHHTSKGGTAGDARSARGSVELVAGPDALLSVDASGEYPTAHFRLRNHESPSPVGYRLALDPSGAARIDVLPPCAGKAVGGVEDTDLLAILRAHSDTGLSESKIRELVSQSRGGKPKSKANAGTVKRRLEALAARSLVSRCQIQPREGKSFGGWRLGPAGGVVEARPISNRTLAESIGDEMGDPNDV
jgi:hypothetical protein